MIAGKYIFLKVFITITYKLCTPVAGAQNIKKNMQIECNLNLLIMVHLKH